MGRVCPEGSRGPIDGKPQCFAPYAVYSWAGVNKLGYGASSASGQAGWVTDFPWQNRRQLFLPTREGANPAKRWSRRTSYRVRRERGEGKRVRDGKGRSSPCRQGRGRKAFGPPASLFGGACLGHCSCLGTTRRRPGKWAVAGSRTLTHSKSLPMISPSGFGVWSVESISCVRLSLSSRRGCGI